MLTLVRNISQLLTMDGPQPAAGTDDCLGLVAEAALVCEDGRIAWTGPERDLPPRFAAAGNVRDARGCVVMPGLVECHTHLLFAGDRAAEFEQRCAGATYEQIAAAGGGILSTVRATRAAGADELFALGMRRLNRFLAMGVATLEAKSGYGLDLRTEIRLLEVLRSLSGRHPIRIVPTFLGAHALPPEFRGERERYVDLVCNAMLPEVAARGLARFCDVFCEQGAFTLEESRRLLTAARRLGLDLKLHAEQLSRSGASQLAAELAATSADHLEFATPEDAAALARARVTGVLLPAATLFAGKTRFADARMLAAAGLDLAVSTDFNPGSSHTLNPWLAGTLACTCCHMPPAAALYGLTAAAARALRLDHQTGRLVPGLAADFLIVDTPDWRSLLYSFAANPVQAVYLHGELTLDARAQPH